MISKINQLLSKFLPLVQLSTRLILGYIFLTSGWGKLNNLSQVIEFFTQLGIPAPQLQAPFIALLELIGGAGIMLGLGTQIFSFLLACTMFVALITAKKEDFTDLSSLVEIYEFGFMVLFAWLATVGGGALSLDRFLFKKKS